MASRELQIILSLKDQASARLNGFNKRLSGVSKTLNSFGKQMSLKATAPIVALGTFAVKSGADLESLRQSFDFMTSKIGVSSDKLLNQLRKTSAGTISDNDLILASNKAMSLGVAKNMEDFTTLMEVARLKGRQMGLSTTQAFDDIVTGIGRGSPLILDNLGITVKLGEANEAYAKSLGKTVDELTAAEKQQALLNAVTKSAKKDLEEFGDLGKTNAERMQEMTAQIQNLKTSIGSVLLPVVSKIVDKVTEFVRWLDGLDGSVKTAITIFAGLVAVIGPIAIALSALISSTGLVVVAISGLVAIIVFLVSKLDEMKAKTLEVWNSIVASIQEKVNAVKDVVMSGFNAVKDVIVAILNGLVVAIKFLLAFIVGLFVSFLDTLMPNWREGWQLLVDFFIVLWENLTSFIQTGLENLSLLWNEVWGGMFSFFMPIWDSIKGGIQKGFLFIVGIFNTSKERLQNAWNGMWDGIKNATKVAVESVKGLVKNAINFIIDKINAFIRKINEIKSKAGKLGRGIPNIPEIPRLAKGGIVTKPTVAEIGEAGPEAVIPLDKLKNFGGGGVGNIVINITGNTIQTAEDIQEMVEEGIMNALRNNEKLQFA